jgi:hypothetical protein
MMTCLLSLLLNRTEALLERLDQNANSGDTKVLSFGRRFSSAVQTD